VGIPKRTCGIKPNYYVFVGVEGGGVDLTQLFLDLFAFREVDMPVICPL